jgi:hypothetical protein
MVRVGAAEVEGRLPRAHRGARQVDGLDLAARPCVLVSDQAGSGRERYGEEAEDQASTVQASKSHSI